MSASDPVEEGVAGLGPAARSSGDDDHIWRGHLLDRVVSNQGQRLGVGLLRSFFGADEADLGAGQPAQGLVRADCVEDGDAVVDGDRYLHRHPALDAGAGATSKLNIMPLSVCSAMWQCAIQSPGFVTSRRM